MSPEPTRPRRGRPPIPVDRIVAAALEIVAEDGVAGLSLRSLAGRLSSSTSTLYRHVANRAELLALVFDELLGEVLEDEPAAERRWDEECRAVATRLFTVLSRHRGSAGLVGDAIPVGPNALALRERLFGILTGAGFPLDVAGTAVATLGHYAIGFAMQSAGSPAEPQTVDHLNGVDAGRYPLTAGGSAGLPIPLDVEFAFGLDLILRGLRHHLDD